MMDRQLKEGDGWRLGWQPTADAFQGLVGTNDWAVELTESEFSDFRRLLQQLADAVEQMSDELMNDETINCDATSDLIWMAVSGYPHQFTLSFILLNGRRAEGQWDVSSTAELIHAIQTISVF